MNPSKRSLLLSFFCGAAGINLSVVSFSLLAATPEEVVGSWLVENASENHELQGVTSLSVKPDGTAVKSYKSSTFAKRWSISKGNLVLVDAPGVTPGPPEEFVVAFLDSAKKQLRLKSATARRAIEIKLSKGS